MKILGRLSSAALLTLVTIVVNAQSTTAQDPTSTDRSYQAVRQESVPRVIKHSGALQDATGKPLSGVVGVTFSIYSEPQSTVPLWVETVNVNADDLGHYTVLLGATQANGLPEGPEGENLDNRVRRLDSIRQ